jgi:hypothetical protein
MTTLEIGLELLNTLKARPRMYCYTKEAVLMRVTTVMEMLGVKFSPSAFSSEFIFNYIYAEGMLDLVAIANQKWTASVVDKALELIRAETESTDSVG